MCDRPTIHSNSYTSETISSKLPVKRLILIQLEECHILIPKSKINTRGAGENLGFDSHHPHSSSQSSGTPGPTDQCFLWTLDIVYMGYITYVGKPPLYIISIIFIIIKQMLKNSILLVL